MQVAHLPPWLFIPNIPICFELPSCPMDDPRNVDAGTGHPAAARSELSTPSAATEVTSAEGSSLHLRRVRFCAPSANSDEAQSDTDAQGGPSLDALIPRRTSSPSRLVPSSAAFADLGQVLGAGGPSRDSTDGDGDHTNSGDAGENDNAGENFDAGGDDVAGNGDHGEKCIELMLDWLSENKDTLLSSGNNGYDASEDTAGKVECYVLRYNHLLSGPEHKKEKAMVDAAKRAGLQGGLLWGTPGIVVAVPPSTEEDAREYASDSRDIGKRSDGVERVHLPMAWSACISRKAD